MRITPLHNIRQTGLIPNGFQREDAPPPAPDPSLQPEMRNRVEAQTDTRHAVEFLNPRARLEINASNRTHHADPPRIAMGREGEPVPPAGRTAAVDATDSALNDAYARLMRILRGEEPPATSPAVTQETISPAGIEVHRREIKAYHQAAVLNNLVAAQSLPLHGNEPLPGRAENYYLKRGVQAYRLMQNLTGEYDTVREA